MSTTATNGVSPETKTVDLPQGRIAYRELGAGAGTPLVFVHGLLVDGRLWSDVPDRLAAKHRCIVPDWPMGSHRIAMNPDADLSAPGMASVVVSFLDALGLDRVILVGNDSGGAVSQMVTAAHPERVERLILTNCDTLKAFPPFPFSLMGPIARVPGGMAALMAPFRVDPILQFTFGLLVKHPLDRALVDSWMEPSFGDAAIGRDARKFTTGMGKRHTLAAAEALRTFERPVRFVWAPEDRFFRLSSAERLAAMLRDTEFAHVEDAKTFSPLDQPERVAELIGRFAA